LCRCPITSPGCGVEQTGESIPGSVGASTIGCHETATGYGGDRPIRTNRVLRLGELVTAGKPALRDQLTIQVAEPGTDWRTVKKLWVPETAHTARDLLLRRQR
jgi:hypothetical protein